MLCREDRPAEREELLVAHNARAHLADLIFDQHLERLFLTRKGALHLLELDGVVDADAHMHAAVQLAQALVFIRADQLIGDKNVGYAALGHDLGLAELGTGDAARARLHLQGGEVRHAVGLDMRTQLQPQRVGAPLHHGDVVLCPVEIDEQTGCGQIVGRTDRVSHIAASCLFRYEKYTMPPA